MNLLARLARLKRSSETEMQIGVQASERRIRRTVFHDSAPPIYSEFLWFLRLAIRDSDFGWVGGRRETVKKTKENTRGRRP